VSVVVSSTIVGPDLSTCTRGHCLRLRFLLEAAVPDVRVSSDRSIALVATGAAPALLIVRAPFDVRYVEELRALRRQWRETMFFGVLCHGWDDPANILTVIDLLDDFISCPFRDSDVIARVRRLLPARQAGSDASSAGNSTTTTGDALIGNSPAFLELLRNLPAIAKSDATLVVTGETGTGKELFARAVHYKSHRQSQPFVPVNCGALPDHLFENEVFGHAKGAFTDAATSEKGLLAVARSGTILLDEIDTLSFGAQSKLLRFLQNGEYRALGSSETVRSGARVIAATNANLRQKVEEKQFREDVFHRLNVLSIHIPPLRSRSSDIPLLARHFLTRLARQYGRPPLRLSDEAVDKMMHYAWPGNVRELEAIIHRAVVLSESETLGPSAIEISREPSSGAPAPNSLSNAKTSVLASFERTYLVNLLTEHKGNLSHAAIAAGKQRRSLQRLVRKYGLERAAFASAS
jgi:DNA-binding NtrC family response regulator